MERKMEGEKFMFQRALTYQNKKVFTLQYKVEYVLHLPQYKGNYQPERTRNPTASLIRAG